MSARIASTTFDVIDRLKKRDPNLQQIVIWYSTIMGDEDFDKMFHYLETIPNFVQYITISNTNITDKTGVRLAHYVSKNNTIIWVNLSQTNVTQMTFLAMAAALYTNTSLKYFHLCGCAITDMIEIENAFVNALRINPQRSPKSEWMFDWTDDNVYQRLARKAEASEHLTLQQLLCAVLDKFDRFPVRRYIHDL